MSILGKIDCVLCAHECELKLTKANKPTYICSNCNLQVFSRGAPSALVLQKRVKAEPVVEVEPVESEPKEKESFLGGLF